MSLAVRMWYRMSRAGLVAGAVRRYGFQIRSDTDYLRVSITTREFAYDKDIAQRDTNKFRRKLERKDVPAAKTA